LAAMVGFGRKARNGRMTATNPPQIKALLERTHEFRRLRVPDCYICKTDCV
jgi:hypothetical protein